MKAEVCDLKRSHGEIKLFPESLDDIWHLDHLVAPGDLVFATTFRSVESATDKLRPEKAEKKPVRLGVRVEKVQFDQNANRIRISGVIEHGPDAGSHHTLNIEAGHDLSVIKTWRAIDLERVERAVRASAAGVIHVLAIEEGEAELFRIRQFGPERVRTLSAGSGKREGAGGRSGFFEEVADSLGDIEGPLVIAGPGFVKDEFSTFLRSRNPGVADRALTAETRRIGRGAVQDVIGQGVLDRITEDIQLAREVRLMEEFLARIGRGGAVAYGRDEVRQAITFGATEQVLVTGEMMRDPAVAGILEEAEKMQAAVVVFSTDFEPGQQLAALGGIAALLRFPIK